MIGANGWTRFNIWEHSAALRDLYARRCRREAEEMTCHAQAAELLAPKVTPGDTVLDVGCGSGYFYHSVTQRSLPVEYYGIDATACLIEIGRRILPDFGLAPERLKTVRLEDVDGAVDHVVCINVLSNIDNYHRPLEKLLRIAKKTVILRESLDERPHSEYRYVIDRFLDGEDALRVHINTYAIAEVVQFVRSFGFDVSLVTDERAGDEPELVIGYPHYWKFLVADRP